jgi:hypothetical protein
MNIDWSALGEVTAVSIAVTVAVVAFFSVGVASMSREGALPRALAGTCFTLCAAATAYGLYLAGAH